MALTHKQVSLIHIAKARLKLSEDDYRDIIRHVGGAERSSELDALGFADVMDYFRKLGFESDFHRANLGTRPGWASPAQIALIWQLWGEITDGQGDDLSLGKWLNKFHGVTALRFVDGATARKVIGALQAFKSKVAARRRGAATDSPGVPPPSDGDLPRH